MGQSSSGGGRGTRIAQIFQDIYSRQLPAKSRLSPGHSKACYGPCYIPSGLSPVQDGSVDRIVSVDAPVARLAEQASVEMFDARCAERNYFLLRDPEYLKVNRESLARVEQAVEKIRDLAPGEQSATQHALENVTLYGQQFADSVSLTETPGGTPVGIAREVVGAYEKDLNELLIQARHKTRTQLIEDSRNQVDSFDSHASRRRSLSAKTG